MILESFPLTYLTLGRDKISHLTCWNSKVLWRTYLSCLLTPFPLNQEWCSTGVTILLPSCRSQLLLRKPTFLLLVYPAVQKSAPGSRVKSNCATNRSPEWTATAMPSGNSVLTQPQVYLWLLLVVAEMSPFKTFKENNLCCWSGL